MKVGDAVGKGKAVSGGIITLGERRVADTAADFRPEYTIGVCTTVLDVEIVERVPSAVLLTAEVRVVFPDDRFITSGVQ